MRYLRLASNWLDRDEADAFTWPYWIDVCVSAPELKVAVSEGAGHGSAGGRFDPAFVLSRLQDKVSGADGDWLLPYLERLARGEVVTEAELQSRFAERHGREPESYDWD